MKVIFENRIGYLYFIQMNKIGPIKIGITKDPYHRLVNLQSANPYELVLLYFTPAGLKTERGVHEILQKDKIRGEWFHPTQRVFREIEDMKAIDKRRGWIMENSDLTIDMNHHNEACKCPGT